jgi:demethylmenaquinone methyltransferase/2-methoxy-6-polyprenyl-1,4-benzoquinol methylase
MFDGIAARYDLLNRIISLGLDQGWRKKTVAALAGDGGVGGEAGTFVDLATGTGDLAVEIVRQFPRARVIGVDPSANMLSIGRDKMRRLELAEQIEMRLGEAEHLPFDDASVDGISIGFGIRNVADRLAGLREMARITRPGGRIAILEGSEPRGGLLAPFARFHLKHVVPRLGAWLSRSPEYRYLQTSISAFPSPEDFADLMRQGGIEVLKIQPLTFGVCHLYVGRPMGEREVRS